MKKEKIINLIILLLLIAVVASSFYFYPLLPEKVITHWDINGEANGWSSRNFQVIFFPALLIFMWLLFKFLPHIDPKAKGYHEFKIPYLIIQLLILAILSIIYIVSNLVNIGYKIPIGWLVLTLIGVMFVAMGFIMPKVKSNWFVGIRTPWALSSDYVWQKTQSYGGKTFVIAGFILIWASFMSANISVICLILAMLIIFSSIVYSYFVHRAEERQKSI